jgi:hypothetical protein
VALYCKPLASSTNDKASRHLHSDHHDNLWYYHLYNTVLDQAGTRSAVNTEHFTCLLRIPKSWVCISPTKFDYELRIFWSSSVRAVDLSDSSLKSLIIHCAAFHVELLKVNKGHVRNLMTKPDRANIQHGTPIFLWQRTTVFIVSLFADRTWKNNTKWCT